MWNLSASWGSALRPIAFRRALSVGPSFGPHVEALPGIIPGSFDEGSAAVAVAEATTSVSRSRTMRARVMATMYGSGGVGPLPWADARRPPLRATRRRDRCPGGAPGRLRGRLGEAPGAPDLRVRTHRRQHRPRQDHDRQGWACHDD